MGRNLAKLLGCAVVCFFPIDRPKPVVMHGKNGIISVFHPADRALFGLPAPERRNLLLQSDDAQRILKNPELAEAESPSPKIRL